MDFTEDLRSYIQTTNYLRKNSSTNDPVMQGLIAFRNDKSTAT